MARHHCSTALLVQLKAINCDGFDVLANMDLDEIMNALNLESGDAYIAELSHNLNVATALKSR